MPKQKEQDLEVYPGRKKGEVYRNTQTGKKLVIVGPKTGEHTSGSEWEKVGDYPHEDEDYSYLCTNGYCRCQQ